jgi:hypothetical protein
VSSAALNGTSCSKARLQCADWGVWWSDCTLVDPVELAPGTSVHLQFADLNCTGTIVSGGAFEGRAAYRVAGGGGGWGKLIEARAYLDDAGVSASVVLSDAARDAGETIADLPSDRMGSHFARLAGAASSALNVIAPHGWRVDFDGTTRIGRRPATTYTGSAPRTRVDPASGVIELATETLVGLVPGVSIDGSAPASDVEFSIDANRITARVWSIASGMSRALNALERTVLALFPNLRYRGAFEFRIVTQSGERLNLQPVRSAMGMPELPNVPVRAGMAGLKAKHLPGSIVVVQFLDADPSRPIVTGFDEPDAPGWMPLELILGGPGALGVARMTDPVVCGPFAGTIVNASLRVKAAL